MSAIANRSPCHVGRIAHMRWLCAKRAWFLSCRSFSPSRIESAQSLSGVGDGEVGRPTSEITFGRVPVTRNAEIPHAHLQIAVSSISNYHREK